MKVPVTFVIRVLLMSVLLSNATSDAFAQATVPGSTIVPVSATEPGAAKADAAFRVDTYIYQDAKKEPVKETLTLFYEGAYYDFAMDATQAVTFIDPRRGRIVLLSPRRQIKTSFHTASLLNDVSEARTKITNSELASVLEAVNKVTFDDQSGKLKVGDTTLSYEATLQTPKKLQWPCSMPTSQTGQPGSMQYCHRIFLLTCVWNSTDKSPLEACCLKPFCE